MSGHDEQKATLKALKAVLAHYRGPGEIDLYAPLPVELADHEARLRRLNGLDAVKSLVANRHLVSLF